MGGQSSKAKSKIVTDIIVEVLSEDLMKCSQMITQQQSMDISGSGNVIDGVSMKQAFYIDTRCSQSINRDTEIQNLIAQKIQQAAEAQGEVIVSALGRTKSEVVSIIKNKISNSINRKTIAECATSINNSQTFSVSGNNNIVRNVTKEQHGEMIKHCSQKLAEQTQLVNDLNLEQQQTATAEEKGLFGWMGSSQGAIVMIVIVIVAAVLGYYLIQMNPKKQAIDAALGMGSRVGNMGRQSMGYPGQPMGHVPGYQPRQSMSNQELELREKELELKEKELELRRAEQDRRNVSTVGQTYTPEAESSSTDAPTANQVIENES